MANNKDQVSAAVSRRVDEAFATRQSERMLELNALLDKAEQQARDGASAACVHTISEARAVLTAMAQSHERSASLAIGVVR